MKKGKPAQKQGKPASVAAQRAWALLTPKQKAILKKRYRQDPDKDNVPTGFDCRPYNSKKQESFLPDDAKWVKAHPVIDINRRASKIGEGTNGKVLQIAGNNKLVVKVENEDAWNDLKQEASFYKKHNMLKLPLMIPLKEVKTDRGGYALVKPKVTPLVEPGNHIRNKSKITDAMLADLRVKLIKLSYKGYIFSDGLQLGVDRANRLLQFDTGAMEHVRSSKGKINPKPFELNNKEWYYLLHKLGKSTKVLGKIERTSALDNYYLPSSNKKASSEQKIQISAKPKSTSKPKTKIYIDPKFLFHAKHEEIYKKVQEVLPEFPEIKELHLTAFYPIKKIDKNTIAYIQGTSIVGIAFNVHMVPTYNTIYHELWHLIQAKRKSTLKKTHDHVEVEATLFGAARMRPEHVDTNIMGYFNVVPKSKLVQYGKMALAEKNKGNKHFVSELFDKTQEDRKKAIKQNPKAAAKYRPTLKRDIPVRTKYNVKKQGKNYAAGRTPSKVVKYLKENIRPSQQFEKNMLEPAKGRMYLYTKSDLKKVPDWMKSTPAKTSTRTLKSRSRSKSI